MAFIPLVLGMRVVMEYSLAGQVVVNVYHVTSTDPIATVHLEAVADLFLAMWDGDPLVELRDVMSNQMALERITVTDVSVPDGEQYVMDLVTPIAGNSLDQAVPNNAAVVTAMRSTFTGRSRRGRNYYAGLPESSVNLSLVSGTVATWIANAIIDLVNRLAAEGYTLVIASYVSGGAPRVTALATPVTTVAVDTIIDSQRRRLPGRGA